MFGNPTPMPTAKRPQSAPRRSRGLANGLSLAQYHLFTPTSRTIPCLRVARVLARALLLVGLLTTSRAEYRANVEVPLDSSLSGSSPGPAESPRGSEAREEPRPQVRLDSAVLSPSANATDAYRPSPVQFQRLVTPASVRSASSRGSRIEVAIPQIDIDKDSYAVIEIHDSEDEQERAGATTTQKLLYTPNMESNCPGARGIRMLV
jgi:hypothetical protein